MMSPNTKKVTLLIMICLLLTGCPNPRIAIQPTPLSVEGTYTHKKTGMKFPESIENFVRTEVLTYELFEEDISVGYNYNSQYDPVAVTVYIYPAPPVISINSQSEISVTARATVFDAHYREIVNTLLNYQKDATLISDEQFCLSQPSGSFTGKKAVLNYKQNFAGRTQSVISSFYLFQKEKWLIKYRATYPWALSNQAPDYVESLMQKLTIPSLEPK